jgi:hypothetical protein
MSIFLGLTHHSQAATIARTRNAQIKIQLVRFIARILTGGLTSRKRHGFLNNQSWKYCELFQKTQRIGNGIASYRS